MLGKSHHEPWKDYALIRLVRHIWEAMRYVWPDAHWPGEQHLSGIESRL